MVGLATARRARPYQKGIIRTRPRGVNSDLPPWNLPPDILSQADNAVFRRGIPQRGPLLTPAYDPPSLGALALHNIQIGSINFWVLHDGASSYAVEGSNWTDITHASGLSPATANHQFTVGALNGIPFMSNGLDVPMYWDGDLGNKFVNLPDFPGSTCIGLYAHRFHLFALGVDDVLDQIHWSDAAEPGTIPASWTASAATEARDTSVADTPGALIGAGNMRGSLVVYKDHSTHVIDYIGGNEVYSLRTLFVQSGLLTRHGFEDINGQHLCVTDGDIVLHDGTSIKSIVNRKRKAFLFNQLDSDNYEKLFVVYYRAKNEVWVCFPESGESLCTRAMIYDLSNGEWGDRELPDIAMGAAGIVNDTAPDETWDGDPEAWDDDVTLWNELNFQLATRDLLLSEPGTPDLYRADAGSTAITTTLARYSLDMGAGDAVKLLKRVYHRIEGETDIDFSLRIGVQDSPEGTITWGSAITFNSDQAFTNVLAKGRYISWEISATTAKPWALTGLDLETEARGYH